MEPQQCCQAGVTDWLTALGTVGAVLVALFVPTLLPKFLRPALSLRLARRGGYRQLVRVPEHAHKLLPARDAVALYFHLEVTNKRPWIKAHNVRVVLLRVENLAGDRVQDIWSGGPLPLTWQHQDYTGPVRHLGPPALADLFHVVLDKLDSDSAWLSVLTAIRPYGVALVQSGACRLRLVVQAQCDEANSATTQIVVDWNGQWPTPSSPDAIQVIEQAHGEIPDWITKGAPRLGFWRE